jgi:hypothetical protein
MLLQALPKAKTIASTRVLQRECMDGKSPGVRACGAKTWRATFAVEVGSSQMNSRSVQFRQTPLLCLREYKFKVLHALSGGPENKSAVPSLGTVSEGPFSSQVPALQLRVSAKGGRAFSGKGVVPNPSVKRTRNGVAPGPRGRVVYPRPHGPGATPLRAAYLER